MRHILLSVLLAVGLLAGQAGPTGATATAAESSAVDARWFDARTVDLTFEVTPGPSGLAPSSTVMIVAIERLPSPAL